MRFLSILGKSIVFFIIQIYLSLSIFGSEISLLDGVYSEAEDATELKSKTIGLGGKFTLGKSGSMAFYFRGGVRQYSYSGIDNPPDDGSRMEFGGGMHYYFSKLGPRFIPLMIGDLFYLKEENRPGLAKAGSKIETSSLGYQAIVAIRIRFSKTFFTDVGYYLFTSYLTSETTTTPDNGDKTSTKKTQLWVSSHDDSNITHISVGMVL